MASLGFKEKRNLFFQYLVLFTVSAAALLLALFFTQQKSDDILPSQDKVKHDELADFDKNTNRIIMLIDTVTALAGKIITESGSSDYTTQTARQLISDFQPDKNLDPANSLFITNITELLNRAITTAAQKKGYDYDYAINKKLLEDCREEVKAKPLNDLLKAQTENPQ